MTKRIIAIAIAAMMAMLGCIGALAATEPTVTSDAICYISYQTGNNDYDGQTMDTAKKQFLSLDDNGCVAALADGGTLIVCGKAYIGGTYTMPALGSTLKITSADGKVNYKNSMPFENPACALKMASGVTLTLQQDTIIDDIILFQEAAMNTILVTNNSTLVIGDKIECMSNIAAANPCYMAIEVEKGSTVILNGGTFEQVSGEGTIVNNGATIVSEQAAETTAEATTEATTAATAEVTTAPKAEESKAEESKAEESTASEASTDAVVTEDTAETTASAEESKETTEEEKKETEPATSADTSAVTEPAPAAKSGLSTGAIIGIVAAVVVVIAVVAVVIIKKKK